MNKINLWLDDKRPMPNGYDLHVYTAQDAIDVLKTGNVNMISLDHDLGDEKKVGSGYQVACWIEEAAYNKTIPLLYWSIHSQNGVGVLNMMRALDNANRYWGVDITS
jgi:hypothetical protein